MTTIGLFILKTYSAKATKAVVQAELVKGHETDINKMGVNIEGIYKELDTLKEASANNRGRIDNLAEAITSLIKTNEGVSARVNTHEVDIVGIKKDIDYLKAETIRQERNINQNTNKLDKMHDTLYNQYNRPYTRQKQRGRETNDGYAPHENSSDYDDVVGA